MNNQNMSQPTDAELAILQVIWDREPCTVRDVHEVFGQSRNTGYTTTLKLMQVMAEKGLVTRDESRRTHIYRANRNQDCTQLQLVRNLLDRAFDGSAKQLIMQALSVKKASTKELAEIRQLLDSLEGDSQ